MHIYICVCVCVCVCVEEQQIRKVLEMTKVSNAIKAERV